MSKEDTHRHIQHTQRKLLHMCKVGQNHIYIRCIYGIVGRDITRYTVIYGVYYTNIFRPGQPYICGKVGSWGNEEESDKIFKHFAMLKFHRSLLFWA